MVHAYNGLALVRQQTAPTSRIHCVITNGGAAANSKRRVLFLTFFSCSCLRSQLIEGDQF
jgi:hypothetical protein